ncbi:MAG: hypothetical protein HY336_01345 [Candidatus Doudnabacteria bacterium]|nr:hypothetical protein [Candidatus Doudnabacteria bacterium]
MKKQDGQIIIIALIFMTLVTVAVGSLVGYAAVQIKGHKQAVARAQALSIAEAGLEAAVWKLNNQVGYSGETGTSYSNGSYTITVADIAGNSKLVKAEAVIGNLGRRTVQATVATGTTNVAFNYGVQVGEGGLEMVNSSKIIGNVYSNGNIDGANSARIQGTAVSAEYFIEGMQVDGNATARSIQNSTIGGSANTYGLASSTVGGNVVATTMSQCTIGGNAIFDLKVTCTIGGNQTVPNPDEFVDPEKIAMPISDEQIDAWEEEAEAGGVISSQNLSDGTTSLGPKKIDGDLILSNDATLIVTGTLWVTGKIEVKNRAIMRLSESFGTSSGVVISGVDGSTTAGYIEIDNTTQLLGSGTAGSYIMLLSQKEGTGSNAINMKNGTSSAVLYAGEGMIEVNNSGTLKEVTAYKLRITNTATITYESGLANAQFSSGPSGGWEILDQSWQLIQ